MTNNRTDFRCVPVEIYFKYIGTMSKNVKEKINNFYNMQAARLTTSTVGFLPPLAFGSPRDATVLRCDSPRDATVLSCVSPRDATVLRCDSPRGGTRGSRNTSVMKYKKYL